MSEQNYQIDPKYIEELEGRIKRLEYNNTHLLIANKCESYYKNRFYISAVYLLVWLYNYKPEIIEESKKKMKEAKKFYMTQREKVLTQARVCYLILNEKGILQESLDKMTFIIPLDEKQLREYYLLGKIHTNAFSDLFILPAEANQGRNEPIRYSPAGNDLTKEVTTINNTNIDSNTINTTTNNSNSNASIKKDDVFKLE